MTKGIIEYRLMVEYDTDMTQPERVETAIRNSQGDGDFKILELAETASTIEGKE